MTCHINRKNVITFFNLKNVKFETIKYIYLKYFFHYIKITNVVNSDYCSVLFTELQLLLNTILIYLPFYSPHIHCIFWIEDAPKIEEDDPETITDFIDHHITCHKPDDEDSTLAGLVKRQMHRHSHTCRIGSNQKCHFHFPLAPMSKTCILEPLEDDLDIEPDKKEHIKHQWEKIEKHLHDMNMGGKCVI